MAEFVRGSVVVLPFPFSDMTGSKRRPALVLSQIKGDDAILCQITSKQHFDDYAIPLNNTDFQIGEINQDSFIRINKIFTADKSLILYSLGKLKDEAFSNAIEEVIKMLKL